MSKDREAHDVAENHARADAQQLSTNIGVLMVRGAMADSHLADIDRKLDAAREKHDPRLIAGLQAQATTAREQVDSISKDMLLTLVPRVADQLRSWKEDSDTAERELELRKYDPAHYHLTGKALEESDADWDKRIADSKMQFQEKLKNILANADSLRRLIMQKLPPSTTVPDDKEWEKVFTSEKRRTEDFPVIGAADYLTELGKRLGNSPIQH